MPRSAAAGDPGPTHPAGSSGRGWSARQSQRVVAGRPRKETNPCGQAQQQHLLAKPCKETGGGLILSASTPFVPTSPNPNPLPLRREKKKRRTRSVARRRSDQNEVDFSCR